MTEQANRTEEQRDTVLIALDGSPSAATAVPVARLVAERLDAQLNVFHVAAEEAPAGEIKQQLGLDAAGLRAAALRVVAGDPAAEILRAAADPQVVLLVLTTHGRAPGSSEPLGHVAEAVVAGAERPILLVRPAAALVPNARTPAPLRLLVPVDGTPTTAQALPPVIELARRLGAALDFLQVVSAEGKRSDEPGSYSAPMYIDQPQHEWPSWGREVIHRLGTVFTQCPPDVPVRMFLARNGIAEEIARFAAEHQEDLIVLVRRSNLEGGRGAVIRQVLQRTPCPVLVVGPASRRT